jgi:hypothetical protein
MQLFTHLNHLQDIDFWFWFWLKMSAKGSIHYLLAAWL